MTNYLLIGDIHSQGKPLSKALKYCQSKNLTPVLLGDLFDSRCDESMTVYVWHQTKIAQESHGAIVLNSNHQVRLLGFLNENFESPAHTSETWRTLAEFSEAGVDLGELKEWLLSRPDGFVFRDSTGRQYACAHAYFPAQLLDTKRQDDYTVNSTSESERELMLWGIYDHLHRRVKWWKDRAKRSWVRVAGHYHTVVNEESTIILDANSGYPDGKVVAFDVEAQELIYFD